MRRTLLSIGLAMLIGCGRGGESTPAIPPDPAPAPSKAAEVTGTPSTPAAETSPTGSSSGVDATKGMRPSYQACLDAAAAVVPATQACIEDESVYQDARLRRALDAARRAAPAEAAALDHRQAAWQADIDRACAWDAATEGQQQRLEANMCTLEAVARRADQLAR